MATLSRSRQFLLTQNTMMYSGECEDISIIIWRKGYKILTSQSLWKVDQNDLLVLHVTDYDNITAGLIQTILVKNNNSLFCS